MMKTNRQFLLIFLIVFVLSGITTTFAQVDKILATVKHQFWGQVYYTNSADEDDSFYIKRFRLGAKGDVTEHLKFAFLFELGTSDPFLLQGWLDYKLVKYANVRVGQFKYPFGIENYSSATVWTFSNPSYVTKSIAYSLGNDGGKLRDAGIQLSGKVDLNKKWQFGYYGMLMNGNGINTHDNNKNKDFVGRALVKYDDALQVGFSFYNGNTNIENTPVTSHETAFGVDAKFKGKINKHVYKLQGEYMEANYDVLSVETKPSGFYAHAAFYVLPHILEAAVRYDEYKKDEHYDLKKSRVTAGLSYYLAEKQKISLNYEFIDDEYDPEIDDLLTLKFQFAIQ